MAISNCCANSANTLYDSGLSSSLGCSSSSGCGSNSGCGSSSGCGCGQSNCSTLPAPIIESPVCGGQLDSFSPVTISGIAMPYATVTIMMRACRKSHTLRACANEFGQFSLTIPALPDGIYTFLYGQQDACSNSSDLCCCTFSVSSLPPIPTPNITYPLPGQNVLYSGSTLFFYGTGTPGNTAELCLSGQGCSSTIILPDGTFSMGFGGPFIDGPYTLTVTQRDAYGNISDAASVNFTITSVVL